MTFEVVVLGCTGGPREDNLSGYLVRLKDSDSYLALDGGTLLSGMDKVFDDVGAVFHEQIKAYLISHAHLDHVAALVLNSQSDTSKPLFGLDSTIDNLRDHLFNGQIWPNYGSEGAKPLKLYTYNRVKERQKTVVPNSPYEFEAFRLNHPHDYASTAYLINAGDNYMIYFGDTSSDVIEENKRLATIWERIAPLARSKKLKGIMLECSYADEEAAQSHYGHLHAAQLKAELAHFHELVDAPLDHLTVIVTHRKETISRNPDPKKLIAEEVGTKGPGGLTFVFPSQAQTISL